MTTRAEWKRAGLACAYTLLLLLGGWSAVRGAAREWRSYQRVASIWLPPDGRERRTPPLRSRTRYDTRIEISGTFRGRCNGVTYDARQAFALEEPPWDHGCLELSPADLSPSAGGAPHQWLFLPGTRTDMAGQRVVARLDPAPLLEAMALPDSERGRAFEGALRLTVWERDRWRQSLAAAGLAALGVLLLTFSFVRLWLQVG